MANRDDEVAALYKLPPAEFTAARNALAKKLGPAAGDVRSLEKPNAAAWAVNQLYWQRRPVYDALIKAAQGMRTAHTAMLSGRKADVPQADALHREAIRNAMQAIRDVATAAGETLSATTLEAIGETLRSLPSDDKPGQLTRPLQPLGFGALMGVTVKASPARPQSAEKTTEPARKETAAERAEAKKEAAESAKERKALEKALRAAEAIEQEAESALAEAKKTVAKLDRDYEATRDRLQFLEKQRMDAEGEVHKRSRAATDAANARARAADDLRRVT
jgi:hypothetical protein